MALVFLVVAPALRMLAPNKSDNRFFGFLSVSDFFWIDLQKCTSSSRPTNEL